MAGVRQGVETPTAVERGTQFDCFYRANYAWAVRVAGLLTGDRWIAEDVAQDSFSRMHPRFDDLDNPAAFLRTCVVNACRSLHRRRVRDAARERPSAAAPAGLDARELLDAVDRLPYRQKAVLVLRYYADLSEADIAMALDCRTGTVKSLASRGLAQLRKTIEP